MNRSGEVTGQRTSSLPLGRAFGVVIEAHWSLLIIFGLVAASLGFSVLPAWHPGWSAALVWSVALSAALLFFASIAVHELAHAIVGRRFGSPVDRITLFLFGGMAHASREPRSPKAELAIAGVGPLVSLIIGVVATFAGSLMIAGPMAVTGDPTEVIAAAGPVATLLLWLGPINIVLAVFNMMPGFPLDGGRVTRALLWWATGDLEKATRWSAGLGSLFGWALIGAGVLMAVGVPVPPFGSGVVGGLWLMLIGWFLGNAARASYTQVVIRGKLSGVPVGAVMRSPVQTVGPDTTLESLVSERLMREDQRGYPVTENGELIGLVCIDDVRKVPPDRWPSVPVREVMTARAALEIMAPGDDAMEALERLGRREVNQIPVVEGGALRGLVRREDILKWLSLRTDLVG